MSIYGKKNALLTRQGEDIAEGFAFRRNPRSGTISRSASTRLVGAQGEYNAASTRDVAEIVDAIITMRQSGEISQGQLSQQRSAEAEQKLGTLVESAMTSRGTEGAFRVLGEVITDEIMETMGRVGFTSKIFAFKSTPEGKPEQIKIRQKDVQAWQVLDDGETVESFVTPRYYQPRFFYTSTKIKFEEGSVHEWGSSLVQEKHDDGVEAVMTREDNITKALLDAAAPVNNTQVAFTALTPGVFSELLTQVERWSIPAPHCLLAIDLWNDIRANSDWQDFYSPIAKHTLVEEGRLGKLMDVEIITDGLRYDTLRVLATGEIFMLGMPVALGIQCERIPLTSKPLEFHLLGYIARGWMIYKYHSLAALNARGVCKGTRL